MTPDHAKQIIYNAVSRYVMDNRMVECPHCENLVRAKVLNATGRFCDSCENEIDYNDWYPCYCEDRSCDHTCGTLWCGCIDTCRGRCGFTDNIGCVR